MVGAGDHTTLDQAGPLLAGCGRLCGAAGLVGARLRWRGTAGEGVLVGRANGSGRGRVGGEATLAASACLVSLFHLPSHQQCPLRQQDTRAHSAALPHAFTVYLFWCLVYTCMSACLFQPCAAVSYTRWGQKTMGFGGRKKRGLCKRPWPAAGTAPAVTPLPPPTPQGCRTPCCMLHVPPSLQCAPPGPWWAQHRQVRSYTRVVRARRTKHTSGHARGAQAHSQGAYTDHHDVTRAIRGLGGVGAFRVRDRGQLRTRSTELE